MATTRRNYRNAILGLAVAGALAWGMWWFVRQGWYAEVVLLKPAGTELSLTIDGKQASPASVREVGDVTCLTFHPPIGTRQFLVRDGESVLIEKSAELESQSVTTYVLFCGGGRWLTEHRIEYGYANRPDFSAFDTGPQTFSGWVTEVDGQQVSFLSRTDDAAGMALAELPVPNALRKRSLSWLWRKSLSRKELTEYESVSVPINESDALRNFLAAG